MLNNLKLKYKILSIPLLVLVIIVLAVWSIYNVIDTNEAILDDIVNGHVPAWETSRILLEDIASIQYVLQNAISLDDADEITEADVIYEDFQNRIQSQKENPMIIESDIVEITDLAEQYYAMAKEAALRQIRGTSNQSTALEVENVQAKYNAIREKLRTTSRRDKENMKNSLTMSQSQNQKSRIAVTLSTLFVVLVSFGLAILIIRNVTKPLRLAIDVADKVANGDLTVHIEDTLAKDEVGTLMQKMKSMIGNLRELTVQIKEAANSLAAASSEISASVTEIASGATETATAANETSTTVEEVRQTALDSNKKAKLVSESAQKAVQVSQSGEKAVTTMVDGMQRIESQMSSIAESIMKLSEHGQAIGGIIATVEDVAEQSNLLAVNASIEAAKAGEQGKGFAVVAMEVKSLAEQSRQATARVRTILDDIQKATGGAVMVTEQGSRAVESGVELSDDASTSIQKLAGSVSEAAQATTQIAVSSQEQLVGMDQVVSAMESIKQASTQNVVATKQVESAAHDLHELGQNLKRLVEQYKV